MLVATGLDPERSTVFAQSQVTAHAEANWLLSSVTSFGELRRMTQFKEKSDAQEFVSAGLFTYPVLQAGDILLYQTDIVPVGSDQRQHIELTRDVAERFNSRYGETFTLPSGVYPEVGREDHGSPGAREEDVDDRAARSRGRRTSSTRPDEVRRKFKVAVTDSGREIRHAPDKPGISNLIEIMTVSTGESIEAIESRYDGQGYGDFKAEAAESVIALLDPIQERYREIRRRPGRAAPAPRARRREGASRLSADARRDVRADGVRRGSRGRRRFSAQRPRRRSAPATLPARARRGRARRSATR